jgi:hypothetical protein
MADQTAAAVEVRSIHNALLLWHVNKSKEITCTKTFFYFKTNKKNTMFCPLQEGIISN